MSCQSEINPKWTHAIDNNICPFCGQSILPDELRNSLSIIREAIISIKDFEPQLNDWMLSNYNFIKTDSPLLVNYVPEEYLKQHKAKKADDSERQKFIVKVETEAGEQDVVAEKIQSAQETNGFFSRAEAVQPNIDGFTSTQDKTQKLKKMVQQIRKNGSPSISGNMLSPEAMENADPQAVAEMQSLISEEGMISSAMLPQENGDDDDIPIAIQEMAMKAKGGTASNNADIFKLKQMQERVANSRKNFEHGTAGKGGFSRA